MSDSKFIQHGGRDIYYIDFTDSDVDSIKQTVEKAKKDIAAEPEGSVLTMTNVTDIRITPELSNLMKAFTAHNKPYVKAGAVLGITGLRQVTFNAVLLFSGRRNLHLFSSMHEAKDWLVKQ
jgi:hypothetical protein